MPAPVERELFPFGLEKKLFSFILAAVNMTFRGAVRGNIMVQGNKQAIATDGASLGQVMPIRASAVDVILINHDDSWWKVYGIGLTGIYAIFTPEYEILFVFLFTQGSN
jgi:hypothetical protein